MSEKTLNNIRIVHKHDTEANWLKAMNFIPKQGELIIYDIDDTYNYERMKIGDGITNVNDLPFTNDNINYISYEEQTLTDEQKQQARNNINAFGYDWYSIGSNRYCANIPGQEAILDWDLALSLTSETNELLLLKFVSCIRNLLTGNKKVLKNNSISPFLESANRLVEEEVFTFPISLCYKYSSNMDNPAYYLYFSVNYRESNNTWFISDISDSHNIKMIAIRDGVITNDGTLTYPDDTLSISGRTAEAKTVGDRLNAITEQIPSKLSELEIDTELGVKSWNDLEDKPFGEDIIYDDNVQFTNGLENEPSASLYLNDIPVMGNQYVFEINEYTFIATCESIYMDQVYGFRSYDNDNYLYLYGNTNDRNVGIRFKTKEWREDSSLIPSTYDAHVKIYGVKPKQLDEKYIPDTIARKEDIIEQTQVDWNQNDENAVDYIKNRTHWSETVIKTMLPEQQLNSASMGGADFTSEEEEFVPIPGEEYLIILNGETYKSTAYQSWFSLGTCLGDSRLSIDGTSQDTYPQDVPVFLYFESGSYGDDSWGDTSVPGYWTGVLSPEIPEATLVIKKVADELEYHKLDENYIPDTIARKSDILIPDTTLTLSETPADAKAVGDALALKVDIATPISFNNIAGVMLINNIDILELEMNKTYISPGGDSKYKNITNSFVVKYGENSYKQICNRGFGETFIIKPISDNVISLVFENDIFEINMTDSSSAETIIVTSKYNQVYLRTNNSYEYTPTADYNPATKKYVDSIIPTEEETLKIFADAGVIELMTDESGEIPTDTDGNIFVF